MRSVSARLLFIGVTIVALGCSEKAPATGAPAGAASATGRSGGGGGAAPVSVANVVIRDMPVVHKTVGTVQAASTVDIRSQVTGQLLAVGFTEGSNVKAGDVLFTLDARPFQATLNQAEAVLAGHTGQLKNAQEQLARADELSSKGMLPKADRDTLASTANSLKSTIAADTAVVENARLQLQYTTILAPVSGRTGALQVHQGSLVRANDTTPLVTINQTSPINVTFAIPARLIAKLRTDQAKKPLTVTVSVPGSSDVEARGAISFIDSSVDASTDTIRVKGVFANINEHLWPGQYVDVSLLLSIDAKATVIPTSAVQASQRGPFVYVLKSDKTVEARPIVVARAEGATTVIASGVTAADQVVTDGQLRLSPGAKVSVKPAIVGGEK